MALHYLTVQDVLWINLQVTKKVHHYRYGPLEEATFCQYGYGQSRSLLPQAGRFLGGFLKLHPFDTGNEATAFVALAGFLKLNGMKLGLSDGEALGWMRRVLSKELDSAEAVQQAAVEDAGHHGPVAHTEVHGVLREVLAEFPETVAALASSATPTR